MDTQTAGRLRADRMAGPISMVAYPGTAAFVIAAVWFWLATKGVTVSPEPRIDPGVPADQGMRLFYRWQATTLPQERYYTSIAIVGFTCLAAAAIFLQRLVGTYRTPARIGALLIGAGSLLWISGSVLVLGGHHAVGLMATHANPIQTTNSIAFTIDTIGDACALAAFTMIGAGMLSFAIATSQGRPARHAWLGCTIIVALVMLATAGSYAAGNSNFSDLMLFISGAVALPLWLVWTGRTSALPKQPQGTC